jgi:hypothetical protein
MLNGATDYTIEAWVKPLSSTIHNKVVLKRWYQFALTLYKDDTRRFYFTHYTTAGTSTFVNTIDNVININAWNHLAVVCNSAENSIKLYANGVDVTLAPQVALPLEAVPGLGTDANFYLSYGGSGTFLNADIDKVRVKKVAVPVSAMQTSITDPAYTTDANTAVLFNLNEGTGAVTINEASGTNADLQFVDPATVLPLWVTIESTTVSIKDKPASQFNLYPNPVVGNRVILQPKSQEVIQKVLITNTLGKTIKTIEFKSNEPFEINTEGLIRGVYLFNIIGNTSNETRKVIVN